VRRVDRFLKLVATLRIRRALRVQGRGLPAGDNAGLSELRASRHLLSLLGFGLDEPVPCPAEMHLAIATEDYGSAAGQLAIAEAAQRRGTGEPVDILSEAVVEILNPALKEIRSAIMQIIDRQMSDLDEKPLRKALGDAIALELERQFPAQEKLQLMRRRQIDDVVALVIEKGLLDVVASIREGFDQARRTYDNGPALTGYEIVDGKLKLKITRKRSSKAASEKASSEKASSEKASSETDPDQAMDDEAEMDEAEMDG